MNYINKKSADLFNEAQKYLVGGVNSPVRSYSAVGSSPVFIKSGKGQFLYDVDGNRYTDFMGSWGPLILGHADPDVIAAIKRAADEGVTFGAPCEAEVELAKLIVDSVPSAEKVRMTNSGTEATMSALRVARGFTNRDFVVKFEGCYHGHADSLLVKAGSGATTFGNPSSPGVPESFVEKTLLAGYNDIESVKELFDSYSEKIAAVIIEPVPGNMGVVLPDKGFLEELRELTSKHGSLLIFDEVITGFRLARGGAQEYFDVIPDMTCLGKIIGGGLPVGAYTGRADIMEMVAPEGPVYQAGTLSGNPLAMNAGLATLKKLFQNDIYSKLETKTGEFVEGIRDIISKTGVNATVNTIGSMFTLFFTEKIVRDYNSALGCDTEKFSGFFAGLLNNGIVFPPSQFESVLLSTVHTAEVLEDSLETIYSVMKEL